MRIAVIGAGGVGGCFGARLARAGHDVTFVARGAHLAAIRERGLAVEGPSGTFVVRAAATDDIASIGPVDVAMVCTKLWDVEPTAPMLSPLLEGGGVAIPFQNGVDAPQVLMRVLGADRVLGGVAYVAAVIRSPGIVAQTGTMARLVVGAFEGGPAAKAEAFASAGRDAGFACEAAPDIRRALWEKFVFLVGLSGTTALARGAIGVVRGDPDLREVLQEAMREVIAVAGREGVRLPEDFLAGRMAFADSLPADMRSSMLNDLVAGHRLEAPWLAGAVVRMGRAHGVPTPVNATILAAMKPYIDGRAA